MPHTSTRFPKKSLSGPIRYIDALMASFRSIVQLVNAVGEYVTSVVKLIPLPICQESNSKFYYETRYVKCSFSYENVTINRDNTCVYSVQCHTHNHETRKRLASSYMTPKSLPLDDRGRVEVALLADTKVSSKYTTSYLR
ncbi:LOW QUALITY PROTEIN: hypothetical protein PHMEG_00021211 [Phytophthora megakarya]|uniref:Uncharacterized protein n=1 Tax=Phytophthora megakarya TaxID=4795 RepID=A0A225VLT1_9STRA|nr:LOW QUALITY PROTEIN: hypothetical protein PHMEG_00021211 [Phytophthora megakarya]